MKTQEEIEKLAEKEYREYPNNPLDEPAWHYNKDIHCHKKRKAFIKGYTQCQEDMKKETFTREELIQCMSKATRWDTFNENEPEYKMDMDDFFKYLINSLNKQD